MAEQVSQNQAAENQRNLRRLVLSVQASYGRLNLLIAICDNWKYRDELIQTYEAELRAKGTSCYRVRVDRHQPSLRQSLQDLAAQQSLHDQPTVVTVLGADELLGIRLDEPKSAQERFFFSLQWTREGLREFAVPMVLWLTDREVTMLAQQAPDFWSWRGGVFEFVQPMVWAVSGAVKRAEPMPTESFRPVVDPVSLQRQIDELQAQDPDSPLLASLYDSLGEAYEDAVRYVEAEVPYRKALEIRERLLGKKHSDTATSLNNLAELYESQGRYSEAEPLLVRSLHIYETQLGADHPDTATSLNNLALLYNSQGRYSEAEPLLVRSLHTYETQLGADHPDTALG
ncbi:MAG: tetratricopeptide repeat protein, partial [Leptolyngbyaceae cyanobacterium CAN_BIN12]|nr:tetratricopeptide repeat protein [Leptolyngbyaceae cyanobacterium CAN_BIN12]